LRNSPIGVLVFNFQFGLVAVVTFNFIYLFIHLSIEKCLVLQWIKIIYMLLCTCLFEDQLRKEIDDMFNLYTKWSASPINY